MNVEKERIEKNLKDFSFPRLSGTKYEKRAFNLLLSKIKELNLKPNVQEFHFSTFYSRIYPKITFSLIFWIFFILWLNIEFSLLVVNLLITFTIYLPLFILTRQPENIKLGKRLKSQNLYVKLGYNKESGDQVEKIKNIFFIAHYDSKGQTYVARVRSLAIFIWTISLIVLSVILILRNVFFSNFFEFFSYIGIIPLGINFLATFILITNTVNNESKGVVDNASGVACVLELLNHFSQENLRDYNFNFWFVLLGAEETGTMGIRFFYKIIKDLDKKQCVINNFESLGKKVGIFISKNNLENIPKYYDLFEKKAKRYGFRTWVSGTTWGVHTDGIYLFQKEFNLYEHGSTEVGRYMHSKYDALDNVNISKLKEICEFVIDLLKDYK